MLPVTLCAVELTDLSSACGVPMEMKSPFFLEGMALYWARKTHPSAFAGEGKGEGGSCEGRVRMWSCRVEFPVPSPLGPPYSYPSVLLLPVLA